MHTARSALSRPWLVAAKRPGSARLHLLPVGSADTHLLPRVLSTTIGRHRLKRPRSAIHKNYLQSSVGFASAAAAGYKKRKVPAMARANGRFLKKAPPQTLPGKHLRDRVNTSRTGFLA